MKHKRVAASAEAQLNDHKVNQHVLEARDRAVKQIIEIVRDNLDFAAVVEFDEYMDQWTVRVTRCLDLGNRAYIDLRRWSPVDSGPDLVKRLIDMAERLERDNIHAAQKVHAGLLMVE